MKIVHGDGRRKLRSIPTASVNLVLTDPPYPCVQNREYGVWTEEEWFDLMNAVVPEFRRILAPGGSAVIILKPNSEHAGRMRLWLWEFLAKWGREWNVVQDCYSWNYAQLPFGGATQCGLMRGSVTHCVWLGDSDCYRNQDAVLWPEAERSKYRRAKHDVSGWKNHFTPPSQVRTRGPNAPRLNVKRAYAAAEQRGGVTPFNLIPTTNTKNPPGDAGTGHPSRTPDDLVRFWIRYLTKPGDKILDPFAGSGTTLFVAREEGRKATGIEKNWKYVQETRKRLTEQRKQKRA